MSKMPQLPEVLNDGIVQRWMQEAGEYLVGPEIRVYYNPDPGPEDERIQYDAAFSMLVISDRDHVDAVIAFLSAAFKIMETEPEIISRAEDMSTMVKYFQRLRGRGK